MEQHLQNLLIDLNKIKSISKKKQIGEGIIQNLIKYLPVEMHIPGYNYCGPGTKLQKRLNRGDKGINRVDEICKTHDINYYNAKNDEDIKNADNQMLNELNNMENPTISEKIGKFISEKGIKTKMMLGSGNQTYCLTCRTETDSIDIVENITNNNRKMIKSKCKNCNRGRSRFLSSGSNDFLVKSQISKVKKK
ncbi:hypothetical protein B4U80_05937 [Leptotrombidium deliense]|uniref:Uncharacterized protein n=1 Tax=Leptotrombidium deliense TaxID=299467 RepID=A0A443RWG9_9ACAR|nr:hypothetical protein B4U80_05937 [Leptotrombidium deliense]